MTTTASTINTMKMIAPTLILLSGVGVGVGVSYAALKTKSCANSVQLYPSFDRTRNDI